MVMAWLVTGAAGYIGSHVLRHLTREGFALVAMDDLSSGCLGRLVSGIPFVKGSILDADMLDHTLRRYKIEGVVHVAGKKSVPESVARPLFYYCENSKGTLTLLEAM